MTTDDTLNRLREANLLEVVSLYLEAKTGEIELLGFLPPDTLENLLLLKVQIDGFIQNRVAL